MELGQQRFRAFLGPHHQVGDDDLGLHAGHLGDRLHDVARLADDLVLGLGQHRAHEQSDVLVVVHQHDPHVVPLP